MSTLFTGCVTDEERWLTMLICLVTMGMIQNKSCSGVDRLQRSSKLSPVHVPRLVHMALPEA